MENKARRKKRIIIIAIAVTLLIFVVPFAAMVIIYESYFGKRMTAPVGISHSVDEFEGLRRERHTFISEEGTELVGYVYRVDGVECRGGAVLAHGFGSGGHRSYMAAVDYLARNGYLTFAYDVTGNDESGGDSVRGLPQGVSDLNSAISYVETLDEFKELPLVIFGHSWGGYSVANVVEYHPEVKAVAALSGFNRSSDLVEAVGKQLVGDFVKLLMPLERLYERIKFGRYGSNTALKAFEDSDMPVLVIHGSEDNIVPKEYGYDRWYERYGGSDRFTFILVEGKGHGDVLFDMGSTQRSSSEGETKDNALVNILKNKPKEQSGTAEQAGSSDAAAVQPRSRGLSKINEEIGETVIKFFDENIK